MPSQQRVHLQQLIHRLFSQNLNLDLMAEAILNMPVLDLARSVVSDHPPPVAPSRSSAPTAATPSLTLHRDHLPASDTLCGDTADEGRKWAPTDGALRCARCIKEGRQCLVRVSGGPAHACQNCHTSKVKCERFVPQPVPASRSATTVTVVPSLPSPLVRPVRKRSHLASDVDDMTSAGTVPAISHTQSGSSSSSGFRMTPMSPPYLDPRITHLERDMANMHQSLEDLHGMVQDMAATQKAGFERLTAQGRPPNLPRASASTSARVQQPPQTLYKVPAHPTASGLVAKVASSSTPSAAATMESEGESDEEEVNNEEDDEDYGEVDEGPSVGVV
ncbi:hypothetical protein NEOLEDRAFT_1179112 [Neolentinus lepideus HHB14362 ss-1]|uniref:Zn(2)-C6 fungal-type domain-containing protein n=1 Tax=Neolentinus lepideus HHB14362 ss-1 TaxID=1314782 RepID=A0A165S6Y0_9AGAM|nr:hypothetical protein NEOLEDRAFT_1179112 [Neolentinus lepideus HHB14362 ss-1]